MMAAQLLPGFQLTRIATVAEPTSQAITSDGRVFYTEKSGNLRLFEEGAVVAAPVLSVAVDTYAERGFDGIVLDPGFNTNNFLYAYFTKADPSNPNKPGNGAKNRLSRFTFDPATKKVVPGSERVLIDDIPNYTGYHNGGGMQFGPDGMLYVGVGEAGRGQLAPDLSQYTGKVLRINPAAYPNIIPADNPYVNTPNARGEVWAYGFRQPFTMAFRPGTGELFVNDVGSSQYEEIDIVERGKNYGWPVAEGFTDTPGVTNPIYATSHATDSDNGFNSAITGGVFYTGDQFPAEYKGKYFFNDFVNRRMRVLDPATGKATPFTSLDPGGMDVDMGPDGSLYLISYHAKWLYKISYVGTGANRAPSAAAKADVTSGATPLTVNFSDDGSSDPDGNALTYAWDFGDGQTGTGKTVAHTYATKGTFAAKLTVSDGKGGTATSEPITLRPGSQPATATITVTDGLYSGGQTINFGGTANDPETGALPASAYDWQVIFHHGNHTHPFVDGLSDVSAGTFVIPTDAEPDPDQWYRIHLTVTDPDGAVTEVTRDLRPQITTFRMATNVPGLTLSLDSKPQTLPLTTTAVAGTTRLLTAPATQTVNGKTYGFVGWSDGAAASHDATIPATASTFTATYAPLTGPTNGLTGTYYDNADFTGRSITRVDADLNFDWATAAAVAGIDADSFSVRWTGKITPTATGDWTFHALANDGVRLIVDGKTIIDDLAATGTKERTSAKVVLAAGQAYDIKVEFFEGAGSASMKLFWSGPGTAKEIVPSSALTPGTGTVGPPALGQTVRRSRVAWMDGSRARR